MYIEVEDLIAALMLAHCDTYVVVLQRDSDPQKSVSLCSVWSDDFSQSKLVGDCTTDVVLSVSIIVSGCPKITAVSAPPDARQNYDRRNGYGLWSQEERGKHYGCYDKSGAPCH